MEDRCLKQDLLLFIEETIGIVTKTIFAYRIQMVSKSTSGMVEVIRRIKKIDEALNEIGLMKMEFQNAIYAVFEAQETLDDILIADVLENVLSSTLEGIQQGLMLEVNIEKRNFFADNLEAINDSVLKTKICEARNRYNKNYLIEYTACGGTTIRVQNKDGGSCYVSGNNNPYKDAILFRLGNIDDECQKVVILGASMFYEVDEILCERPDVEIVVIEQDAFLVKKILESRRLTDVFSNDRFHLLITEYARGMHDYVNEDCKLIIPQGTINRESSAEIRNAFEDFRMQYTSRLENKYNLRANFLNNCKAKFKSVDDIRKEISGKTVYYVGGGPSLDDSIDYLKKRDLCEMIISSGTSAARLLQCGILPDYIIITDASDHIKKQIEDFMKQDMWNEKCKLLYLTTANSGAVETYQGERYAIFQNGYEMAEKEAKKNGYTLFETGGSVSTTAIDIALRFGCDKLICLGLDLAYTGGVSHAKGTLAYRTMNNYSSATVKSVEGKDIPTARNLNIYRKWIEKRIENEHDIELINISKGAIIQGMKNLLP